MRSLGYDGASRPIRETNAVGAVTSYAYSVDANSQSVTMVTNADGGIRIETRFRDGAVASVTGSASFPVRYAYGVTNEGGAQRAYTLAIKLDASGNDTLEWEQTFTDQGGRTYKTVYPGGSTPARQSYFNSLGQLWKEADPDGVITLFQYNVRGEREYTCIDSNRNDVIDFTGLDRVTRTVTTVVADRGTNVLRTSTYVWETDGVDSGTLLSTVDRSVEGLKTWQTLAGIESSSVRTLASGGAFTVTQTDPNGAYTVNAYQSGRLASVTRYDSGNGQVGKTTFGYDGLGRRYAVTDARNGTTFYGFDNADRVTSVTTPLPGTPGGNAQTTTSFLDAMGRATNVVQADGSGVVSVFSPRGELLRTSGSRIYPVGYAYDAQGRMKHMTNWSGFSTVTGARVTTWHYDVLRGWLTILTRGSGCRGTV